MILLCRNHHKEIDTLIDSFPEEIKFLVRISSGKELMNILSDAMGYRVDYDNIISKDEADYIGSTLQTFIDYRIKPYFRA